MIQTTLPRSERQSVQDRSPDTTHGPGLWIERLVLTDFRNYASLALDLGPEPVVLTGPNGAGKTNLLEAVSLLAPGRGLRRTVFTDVARRAGDGGWAVAATLHHDASTLRLGTGLRGGSGAAGASSSGREVRIDGDAQQGTAALGEFVRLIWLTPAMDGLFAGPASERRRFLDRLVLSVDPAHARRSRHYERAMRQRNRLLEETGARSAEFDGLEMQLAETGVAIAAARRETVARLAQDLAQEASAERSFPWAAIALEGQIEALLDGCAAVEAEDEFARILYHSRDRDRAAKRMLNGPHLSDLLVQHGPKASPARECSTGEQKALLIGLTLAHARLIKRMRSDMPPLVLLDEVAAHLDQTRRAALFDEILALGAQAWMTGTDRATFAPVENNARVLAVCDGVLSG